jgi:hypothetical protein
MSKFQTLNQNSNNEEFEGNPEFIFSEAIKEDLPLLDL